MGLFSAIGSFFGPVGTVFGALADTSIARKQVKRQNAAAEAAYQRQLAQDAKNRELAKQDAANKFVDMNAAAKKAGINPLTALRATGGAGFGMYGGMTAVAPVLSKFNFASTFGKNLGTDFFGGFSKKKLEDKVTQVTKKINTAGTFAPRPPSTTQGGIKLPNDPTIPTGYTVPDEVMEQFPTHVGALSVSPAPMSAAATVEEQYGDVASWFYGPAKFVADMYFTGMEAAVNAGAQGFNNPNRGKMAKKRLVNQYKNNRGAVSVAQVYKTHKNDIALGVLPPLSQVHFIKNGQQVF